MLDNLFWTETMAIEPMPLPTFKTAMSKWPSGDTVTTCWHEDLSRLVSDRR